MNRREFLKITGGTIAAGTVGATIPAQAITLDEYKKNVINPAAKVLADKYEYSYGYARYIMDYDINMDSMVARLDVMVDDKQVSASIYGNSSELESKSVIKELKRKVMTGFLPGVIVYAPPMVPARKCYLVKM